MTDTTSTNKTANKKITFSRIIHLVNLLRIILVNIVFWGGSALILLLIAISLIPDGKVQIQEGSLLNINPYGTIVYEYSSSQFQRNMDSVMDEPASEILLKDIQAVLNEAASDERIEAVLFDLSGFNTNSITINSDFIDSINNFKESGKPVYFYSEYYNQWAYSIASTGDRIFLDPMGTVYIPGFAVYKTYFKEALDLIGVNVHVFRAGNYKSFIEPFTRIDMSEDDEANTRNWLFGFWDLYKAAVADNRGLTPQDIQSYADELPERVSQWGNPAEAALNSGFVDELTIYQDLVNSIDVEFFSKNEEKEKKGESENRSLVWVDYYDYLTTLNLSETVSSNDQIALIMAEGDIIYGYGFRNRIGSQTYSELFNTAFENPDVKAVVLYINSGGGSSFASEIIRREIEKGRNSGIPVVVIMGDMAASGAYWIACESDYIYSYPSTLTGSIGVFSIVPSFEQALNENLHIYTDGFGTTELAGSQRLDRGLTESAKEMIQSEVDWIYSYFLGLVSKNRGIDYAEADDVGQGQVWLAGDAVEKHLVDEIGTIDSAISKAAELAGLEDYSVVTQYAEEDWRDSFRSNPFIQVLFGKTNLGTMAKDIFLPKNTIYSFNDPSGINAFIDIDFVKY